MVKGYFKIVAVLLLITVVTHSSYSTLANVANYISSGLLYTIAPYALAAAEHVPNKPITRGECRLKNLIPNGTVIIGKSTHPSGKVENHVYALTEEEEIYDRTCPDCDREPFVRIRVNDYSVEDIEIIKSKFFIYPAIVYVVTALFLRKLL